MLKLAPPNTLSIGNPLMDKLYESCLYLTTLHILSEQTSTSSDVRENYEDERKKVKAGLLRHLRLPKKSFLHLGIVDLSYI